MPSSPDGIRSDTTSPTLTRNAPGNFPASSPIVSGLVSSTGGNRSDAIVAGPNPKRLRAFIKNNSAAAHLHVKLGPGCSTTDYHFVLQTGTVAANGTGGEHRIEDYKGEISVASSGTIAYSFYEIAVP